MKIWVTLPSSPGSLMAGGLERCDVWFSKPRYQFVATDLDKLNDQPFFSWSESQGLGYWGWKNDGGNNTESRHVSFGKVFGYTDSSDTGCNKLAEFVWRKIKEHIGAEDIRTWGDLSKAQYRHHEFILELDLQIDFIPMQ